MYKPTNTQERKERNLVFILFFYIQALSPFLPLVPKAADGEGWVNHSPLGQAL